MNKQKLLSIITAILITLKGTAQSNVLQLNGLPHNVQITLKDSVALVISDSDTNYVGFLKVGNIIKVVQKDSASLETLLQLSAQNKADISTKYKSKYSTITNAADYLLCRAAELGGTIILNNSENVQGGQINIEDAIPDAEINTDRINRSKVMWLILAALLGLSVLGFLLYNRYKTKAAKQAVAVDTVESKKVETTTEEFTTTTETANVHKQEDMALYKALLAKVVTPAREALKNGDLAAAQNYLCQALYQLNMLCNKKLESRNESDKANEEIILGKPGDLSQYKIINKDTPTDDIPKEIQSIIKLLQQQQATEVSNTIIADYKIKDI